MKNLFALFIVSTLLVVSCNSSDLGEEILQNQEPKPIGEFIDDWSFRVFPKLDDNFGIAEFRLWVPDNINNIKAILVLSNSYNSNGLGLVNFEEWQTFAIQNNLSLLSVHLKDTNQTTSYTSASNGSGNALLKALDTIAYKNNVSYISKLPFLLQGYSAGGVFSYYFSDFKPERVIAFANIRGGAVGLTSDANNNIPGLMLLGENDAASRNQNMGAVVLSKRDKGGAFCYAIEPNVDHFGDLDSSWELIRAFFTVALNKRLTTGSNTLHVISENTGWLGNNATKEIFAFDSYPNPTKEASWLIDKSFALKWKAYQSN